MNDGTLPGCFGYYGKPVTPNQCDQCPVKADCRKYLPKESLKAVLAKVAEAIAVLRGW